MQKLKKCCFSNETHQSWCYSGRRHHDGTINKILYFLIVFHLNCHANVNKCDTLTQKNAEKSKAFNPTGVHLASTQHLPRPLTC